MNVKLMTLSALVIGATVVHGAKKEKTFGNGTLPTAIAVYDINEDGRLDGEEVLAMRDARKEARGKSAIRKRPGGTRPKSEVDTDGDGEVTDEERFAARDAAKAAINARRAERFGEVAGDNGELELEEFSALPPMQDATVERVESIFARLDADADGHVTLDEFASRLRNYGNNDNEARHDDDTDGDTVPDVDPAPDPDPAPETDEGEGDNVDPDPAPEGEGLIDEINEGDTVEAEDAGRPDGSGNDVSATKPEDAGKPDPAGKSDDAGRPVDSGNDVSAEKPGETGKPVEDEVVDPDSDDDTVDDGTTVEG